ncbi:hypothetical protein PPL_09595 [Heterostelium album PN500]|uniref:S-adenosyl-L-methionine-dependent methyltransferase n=1 Tax=Heterostelium pallidum (strain ATCC 26659 / Pp 5 / PN500) TaxID=670386 RepID=D3BNS4_HETP5|nr:hypothetical protein PPL_09595 [Heterostelium album PN500]EFA76843.1 hypothetical protein PPL_09595 [Heterostelium album PN500]|eukprot:XP_020428975.1 hypothetical protein PPL_09595 [Heterostelium album PN500]
MEVISIPSTSLFVCSSRLFITNSFIERVLNNPNSDDQTKELVKPLLGVYDSSLPNLLEKYLSILVYDPYSYYFCQTAESSLIVSNAMDKANLQYPGCYESESFRKEVLEEIKFPTNLSFKELKQYIMSSKSPMMSWTMLNSKGLIIHMLLRTKYIDDFVQEKINEGYEQFVILGAGFDTRGYRMPFKSGTTVWEVDFPEVLNYKRYVIEGVKDVPKVSQADNVYIISDLLATKDWTEQLEATGFNRNKKTIWIMEGLLPYIERSGVSSVLKTINSLSTSGSGVCFENILADESKYDKHNPIVIFMYSTMRSHTHLPFEFIPELGFTKDVKVLYENQTQKHFKISDEEDDCHVRSYLTIAYK